MPGRGVQSAMKPLTATELIQKNNRYWKKREKNFQKVLAMQAALFEKLLNKLKSKRLLP
jgi:hypothetical protein